MTRVPTSVIAALSLAVGFATVQVTGIGWVGGGVVLAGAGWCVAREVRRTAAWRLGVVLVLGAGSFVLAHVLAGPLGAWPAVLVVAAALGAATHVLVPRAPSRPDLR